MSSDQDGLRRILWPDAERVPVRTVRCRHCGTKNRAEVPTAVFERETCRCGSCGGALFLLPGEALTAISSKAYEHSLDRASLEALQSVPGFHTAMRWLLANVNERMLRLSLMSGTVRCGDDQFPELQHLMDKARHRLDLPYRPELHLGESPFMNALSMGVDDPVILVHSALLDQMSDAEVTAVLAHELGHLHADHALFQTMARVVLWIGSVGSIVLNMLSVPIQLALLKWARCAELTSDRAALLGCDDLGACLRLHMKMAGGFRPGTQSRTRILLKPFVQQARELEETETTSWFDNMLVTLLTMNRTHPFAAWRVMHLLKWVERGNYLDILAGDYPRVKRDNAPAET